MTKIKSGRFWLLSIAKVYPQVYELMPKYVKFVLSGTNIVPTTRKEERNNPVHLQILAPSAKNEGTSPGDLVSYDFYYGYNPDLNMFNLQFRDVKDNSRFFIMDTSKLFPKTRKRKSRKKST